MTDWVVSVFKVTGGREAAAEAAERSDQAIRAAMEMEASFADLSLEEVAAHYVGTFVVSGVADGGARR